MKPSTSLVNFTPISTGFASEEFRTAGTADEFHKLLLLRGHPPAAIETVMPAPADSMLPLASIARLRMVAMPNAHGGQSELRAAPPRARCQVAPPSVDTSTPATAPPLSVAVPLIVSGLPPCTWLPDTGEVMEDTGAN